MVVGTVVGLGQGSTKVGGIDDLIDRETKKWHRLEHNGLSFARYYPNFWMTCFFLESSKCYPVTGIIRFALLIDDDEKSKEKPL